MSLTKEQILKAEDVKTQTVDVPEWGGQVIIRMLTGKERDAFEGAIVRGRKDAKGEPQVDMDNIRARLCVAVIVDDKGKQLFGLHEIGVLGQKSGAALDRVFSVDTLISPHSPHTSV